MHRQGEGRAIPVPLSMGDPGIAQDETPTAGPSCGGNVLRGTQCRGAISWSGARVLTGQVGGRNEAGAKETKATAQP